MIQLFQESIPFSNKRLDAPASKDGSFLNPVIMPFAINTTLGSNVFETVIYIRNTSIENFYNDVVVCLLKESSTIHASEPSSGILKTENTTGVVTFSLNDYQGIVTSVGFPYSGDQSTVKTLDGAYKQNYEPVLGSTTITGSFMCNTVNNSTVLSNVVVSQDGAIGYMAGDILSGVGIQSGTTIIATHASARNLHGPPIPKVDITLSKPMTVTDDHIMLTLKRRIASAMDVKFSYGYDELSGLDWDSLSPILVIPRIGNSTTPDTSYIPIRMRLTFNETPSMFTIRDYFIDISYVFEGDVG